MFGFDLTQLWTVVRQGRGALPTTLRYVAYVLVPAFRFSSVFGFALLVNMVCQM